MESMERLKNKKILVTGGAGFIGSHLTLELINKDAKVFVIDKVVNKKSFFSANKLIQKAFFRLIDIRHKNSVYKFFEQFRFDYVFHLAAEAVVQESYKDPCKTFETNIMGTVHILEAARKSKSIKGIIVASSDKAYGKTKKAYTENSPLRGDHPYDVSKSSMDLICQSYFKTYNLPIVVTRFGNVYGEGDLHFDRIVPGICEAVNKKKILEIRSDGTYVRDYLYVKDVVNGYIFLLKNIDRVIGQAYNFSSQDTLSVLHLIKKAESILDQKVFYKILNTAKNEIPYQHLDDSKINKLGWKPKYNLDSTIKTILSWYKLVI